MSDSLQPCGLEPASLLCPWNSPGKNTRVGKNTKVGCHFLLQGNLPDPRMEPTSLEGMCFIMLAIKCAFKFILAFFQ